MKLFNTLSRQIEELIPLDKKTYKIYSCGPTVYDHVHIGNLSAFIVADLLRRVLTTSETSVIHVMNFTDVDDKTIARSQNRYPSESPETALKMLTDEYKRSFLMDMQAVGNDISKIKFVSAVENISGMRDLITELYQGGFAYIADDGVYFSIDKYRKSGKKYGQLLELSALSTSQSRISNDEYNKKSLHDFALWKTRKGNEPAWEFDLDSSDLLGRPGWHIECSVMSTHNLGQPFDIHTGGVDLIFPHHENEIAQSTAGHGSLYAKLFFHNEHLLVDGKKMSKSLNNFYTLRDIAERGFDPLAFRLMILQSHYRSQSNFTWETLQASQKRLADFRAFADLRYQPLNNAKQNVDFRDLKNKLHQTLSNDLSTPEALALLSSTYNRDSDGISINSMSEFIELMQYVDAVFGLDLLKSPDITKEQKNLIAKRQQARKSQNWAKSDEIRSHLTESGIEINDTTHGTIWHRL